MSDLSLAQRERLTKLVEEFSEVIKVAAKILLYGKAPYAKGVHYNNINDLETELGHAQCIVARCIRQRDLNARVIEQSCMKKHSELNDNLLYQDGSFEIPPGQAPS